jgi:hypothetical protein
MSTTEASANTRVIDTREMGWEVFPGLADSYMKPLITDADGNAMVMVRGMPAGEEVHAHLPSMPYRHYHKSVYEHTFYLAGELPHWDYPSADDGVGALVMFQQGYYLDGAPGPGGLHGIEKGPRSLVGGVAISWRNGIGNNNLEPNFHEESIEVDYPADKDEVALVPATPAKDGTGLVYQSDARTIIDTRAMAWAPYPDVDGAYIKVLKTDDDGQPMTMLAWFTRGTSDLLRTRPDKTGQALRENLYVLSGELPHRDEDGTLRLLPEGTFIDRPIVPANSLQEASAEPIMPVGCTVLVWRVDYLS